MAGFATHAGRARVNLHSPSAQKECDRCREWYNKERLHWQYQWSGAALINTGLLVCERCLDKPFEQYRVLILPGDPIPVLNPRPSPYTTPPAFSGETAPTAPFNLGFSPIQIGVPTQGNYPAFKQTVLADIVAETGIPLPAGLFDCSTVIVAPSVSQPLAPAAPRTWLAIYSPTIPPLGFSTGTAILGAPTTIMFGAGLVWFWANAQGLGEVYQGALTTVGLVGGMPIWCWQDGGAYLYDDLGRLVVTDLGIPVVIT